MYSNFSMRKKGTFSLAKGTCVILIKNISVTFFETFLNNERFKRTQPSVHRPLHLIPAFPSTRQDKMGDGVQALVIDNGYGMCKAGFAGENAPR